jgi:DNA replication and repair protein RecF
MLQTLELANFRSYKNGLFQFSDGVNIIVGPNASGKTNLLEAIYMIAQGKTFKSEELATVRRESLWARIDCTYNGDSRVVKLSTEPFKKTYLLEDNEIKRLRPQEIIPVVLFEPSHLLLLGGEPEKRRSYIDELLCQTDVEYANALKQYKRALAQRNKLLKQDEIAQEHLFVWNVRLSELAGKIVEKRLLYIQELNQQLTRNYRSVSGNEEELHVTYESKLSIDQYANAMLHKLNTDYALDRARRFTGSGPHRDDMSVFINSYDIRNNASRGEARSVVLALKLAELKLLEQKTQRKPLLLFDDVFSELDGKRRRTLAQTLKNYQTFITTTDADVVIDHFSETCNIIPTNQTNN